MTPTQEDVCRVIEMLESMSGEQVRPLRQAVSRTIRAVTAPREANATTRCDADATAAVSIAWTPPEVAMLWVLWLTSNEFLEAQMKL